jgi:hypothetical protein
MIYFINCRNPFNRELKAHLRDKHVKSLTGLFRVNAFKTASGEWVEHSTGNKVKFHHFPDFKATQGKPGDTLLWDPHRNKLILASRKSQHPTLCFRQSVCKGNLYMTWKSTIV